MLTPYETLLEKYATRLWDQSMRSWRDERPWGEEMAVQAVRQAPAMYSQFKQALPRGSSVLKGLSHAEDAVNTVGLLGQLFQTPYYQATQEGGSPRDLARGVPGGFYDPYSG